MRYKNPVKRGQGRDIYLMNIGWPLTGIGYEHLYQNAYV